MGVPDYIWECHLRPGRYWSPEEKMRVRSELQRVGEATLTSVPDYQCFSHSPSAFDDKVLVIARERGPTGHIVAFVSAVLLTVDGFGTVCHTGLTCILPENQRQGLQSRLFIHLFLTLFSEEFPAGLWITSCTGSPLSLVGITLTASNVYPSPYVAAPQDAHQQIARAVTSQYRTEIDIADGVKFDDESFLLFGNAPPGSPWYKDPNDTMQHHRQTAINDYYVALLAQAPYSEVLQVGYMDPAKLLPQSWYMRTLLLYAIRWVPAIKTYGWKSIRHVTLR